MYELCHLTGVQVDDRLHQVDFAIQLVLVNFYHGTTRNYFDKETEIYKGMKKIDDDLGGTTPLNVILKFPIIENTITITKLTFIAKDQIISDTIQYPKNSNLSFC